MGLRERDDVAIESQIDACLSDFFSSEYSNIVIKAAHEQVAAVKLCDLGAQSIEDAGKLGRDITTTYNQ